MVKNKIVKEIEGTILGINYFQAWLDLHGFNVISVQTREGQKIDFPFFGSELRGVKDRPIYFKETQDKDNERLGQYAEIGETRIFNFPEIPYQQAIQTIRNYNKTIKDLPPDQLERLACQGEISLLTDS